MYPRFSCMIGAFLLIVLAYTISKNRKQISLRTIGLALVLELLILFCLLKTSVGGSILAQLVCLTQLIHECAQEGITFVFGALGSERAPWGFVFALHVLPIIIFFSALIAVLSYSGVIDVMTRIFSSVISFALGTTRAEAAGAVVKSFLGPTEQQLFIRDYLISMTESELFVLMVSGLSMVSASLFVVYIGLGAPGHHLITANLIGIPGALLFAKMLVPAVSSPGVSRATDDGVDKPRNFVGAIIKGTLDGLQLVLAIGALLISFLAIIALLNHMFTYIGSFLGLTFTFQDLVGYLFAPWGILMGLDTDEALKVSELIGIKFLANEMVAFAELTSKHLSERGLILATYALCGFANIATVGIVVGGLTTLIPTRRSEFSSLAWYALIAATLSNLFSAYLVGIFL